MQKCKSEGWKKETVFSYILLIFPFLKNQRSANSDLSIDLSPSISLISSPFQKKKIYSQKIISQYSQHISSHIHKCNESKIHEINYCEYRKWKKKTKKDFFKNILLSPNVSANKNSSSVIGARRFSFSFLWI